MILRALPFGSCVFKYRTTYRTVTLGVGGGVRGARRSTRRDTSGKIGPGFRAFELELHSMATQGESEDAPIVSKNKRFRRDKRVTLVLL